MSGQGKERPVKAIVLTNKEREEIERLRRETPDKRISSSRRALRGLEKVARRGRFFVN